MNETVKSLNSYFYLVTLFSLSFFISTRKKLVVRPTTLVVRIFYKLLLVGATILVVHVTTQFVEATIL